MKRPRPGVGARVAIGLSAFVLMILLVVAVRPNALKHRLERIASARLNRFVTIRGKLQVRAWSWSPTVVMEGLTPACCFNVSRIADTGAPTSLQRAGRHKRLM